MGRINDLASHTALRDKSKSQEKNPTRGKALVVHSDLLFLGAKAEEAFGVGVFEKNSIKRLGNQICFSRNVIYGFGLGYMTGRYENNTIDLPSYPIEGRISRTYVYYTFPVFKNVIPHACRSHLAELNIARHGIQMRRETELTRRIKMRRRCFH